MHLISVVLGAPSVAARDADTLALLRYGLRSYRSACRSRAAGRSSRALPVAGRPRPVRLVARRSLALVLARSASLHASRVGVPAQLRGPLPAGTVDGSHRVREDGRVVADVPLVTAAVPALAPAGAAAARGMWAGSPAASG